MSKQLKWITKELEKTDREIDFIFEKWENLSHKNMVKWYL